MNKLNIQKLYILSGLPGSGKSTFLKKSNIPDSMVISSDQLRKQIYGIKIYNDNGIDHEHLYGWDKPGNPVFDIMKTICKERLKERLTTFIDTTALTDKDRQEFIAIAQSLDIEYQVLIFDIDVHTAKDRNFKRVAKIDEKVIERMNRNFQRDSAYPYIKIDENITYSLHVNKIQTDKLDIIGDVHGLFDELFDFIKSQGYVHNSDGVPIHPDARKILFLGDVVDRGRQSLLTLHYAKQAVQKGGHYFIPGNHEDKLYKTWDVWIKTGEAKGRSRSSSETFLELIKQPMDVQKELMSFIQKQPTFEIISHETGDFVCAHADISYFDPFLIPRSGTMYGDSNYGNVNSDKRYQYNYDKGINKYILFRGHVAQIENVDSVYSLEFDQAYEGYLGMLKFDQFVNNFKIMSKRDAFNSSVQKYKTNFNYDKYQALHFKLSDTLVRYEKNGIIKAEIDKPTGMRMYNLDDLKPLLDNKTVKAVPATDGTPLSIYKYERSVFFGNRWDEHPFLLKARGLVLDMAGKIIQHPFDKIFNYGENGTALNVADNEQVQVVEKLNGFLGCITKNPYNGSLLCTTTGSFNSDFVGYIKDFITPDLEKRLLDYFEQEEKNGVPKTLMFEVIHPKDNEHPVEYKEDERGLYLIGAREKNIDSQINSEEYLDHIGSELGIKRPKHFMATFGEVRKLANTEEGEGYIVRKGLTPIVKFKTTNYLAIKFIGRLSEKNVAFMYKNTNEFKKRLDEEYVPMVDALISKYPTAEEFLEVPKSERMGLIRNMVKEMRKVQEFQSKIDGIEDDEGFSI